MAQWKIRVVVPDGPDGHEALAAALAEVPAAELQLAPPIPGVTQLTGDVVIELSEERSLPDLLHALHELSPQVFISRIPQGEPRTASAAGRKMRVRKLRGALFVVS